MTASFASLGIKIDARDVKAANEALDKFATASKNAEQANKANEAQSVKTNLSYEKTILKLTESSSAYNHVIAASKGYTQAQIAAISAAERYAQSVKTAQSYQDANNKTVQRASEVYMDMVNKLKMTDAEYKNHQLSLKGLTSAQISHINALEAEKKSANEAAIAQQKLASERKSFISGMSLGANVNPYSNIISGGMGQSGRLAQEAKLAAEANNKLAESSKNAAHAHGMHEMSIGALTVQMAKMMVIFNGINAIFSLPSKILETNIQFENLRVQLNGVMGSAAEGAATFDRAMRWAVKTPFELKDITQAFITLKNFGIDPTEKTMDSLTNQAARLGKGSQGLETITQQLGQAWTKGKLQMQDMRIMMEAGVPVIDILSKAMGKSAGAIFDMSEKGTLGRDSIKLLIDEMGRITQGSNAAAMETLAGKISNLSDAWHIFEDTLLNDKSEGYIKTIVESATSLLNILSRNMGSTLDAQISHAESRIKTYENLNPVVKAAGFIGSLGQYNINDEKMELARLKDLKRMQDTENKKREIEKSAAAESKKIQDEKFKADEEAQKLADKAKKKANRESESEAKKAITAAENHAKAIKELMANIQGETEEAKLSGKEKAYETELRKNLKLAINDQERAMITLATQKEMEAKSTANFEKSKNAEIDKYNQLTMSAKHYYEWKLKIDNPEFTKPQISELSSLRSTNTKIEENNKTQDDAIKAMDTYANKIEKTSNNLSELKNAASAVFDGALGGINLMVGAFDNLILSIEKTAESQANLGADRSMIDQQIEFTKTKDFSIKSDEERQKIMDNIAKGEKKYSKESIQLSQQEAINKISGARQVSGAVESMLKKGSTEQRAAHAVTMALAGVELAMNIMKVLGIGAVTAAETASIVPSVAASTTKGAAKAAEAVATQATAGPYIGFALMAAMAVAMAAIGFNTGAVGIEPPKPTSSPTTGTVLGDSSSKSESVDKTYNLLKDIHASEYATLQSIDRGISDLHSGITDVITRLFQAGGLSSVSAPKSTINYGSGLMGGVASTTSMALQLANLPTAAFGMNIDPISNFLLGGIFGGKQESNVTSQGISTSPTSITDVMAGRNLNAQQFAQIETKTSGGWFSDDEFSFSTQYSALDSATQKALNGVFKSMGDTMLGLADNLGAGLSDRVKNYIIPALSVDLKGLSGEDAAKKLNNVISTALDTMSTAVFGDILAQYQKLGEGMLETAVRIVSEVAIVRDAILSSGLSMGDNAIAVSDALVTAAGGLKEFQQQFNSFFDKFFSESEKQAKLYDTLTSSFQTLNISLPGTREGYKNLVSGLNLVNEQDQKRYSMLISLSSAADTYYSGLEDANAKAQQVADDLAAKTSQLAQSRANMEIQLLEAQGKTQEALIAKRQIEMSTMDESLKSLQSLIYATQDYNSAKSALDAENKASINAALQLEKTRSSMEITLLNAQGKSQEALNIQRQNEINAMDSSLQITQKAIYAAQDYTKAQSDLTIAIEKSVSEANTALDTAFSQLNKVVNVQIKAQQDLLNALTSIADKLHAALGITTGTTSGVTLASRASAQTTIQTALTAAQEGQSLANFPGLENALTEISKPSEQLYKSFAEYSLDQAKASSKISQLSIYADAQVSVAQQSLTVLEKILEQAQLQVDNLKGVNVTIVGQTEVLSDQTVILNDQTVVLSNVNTSLLTVPVAMSNFTTKLNDATQAQITALDITTSMQIATLNANSSATNNVANAMQNFISAGIANNEAQYALAQYQASASSNQLLFMSASQQAVANTMANAMAAASAAQLAMAQQTASSQAASAASAAQSATLTATASLTTTGAVLQLNSTFASFAATMSGYMSTSSAMWASQKAAWTATANGWYMSSVLWPWAGARAEGPLFTPISIASAAAAANIPGFAVGINEVPYDMTANIHAGERIMPAADNKELMMRLSEPRNSVDKELAYEIRKLRAEVAMLRASNEETARYSKKTSDTLIRVSRDGESLLTTPA